MKYKNVLIMGYKTSGQYVEKILLDKKISYMVYDKKYVKSGGKFLNKLKNDTLVNFDLAIVSPGISVYDKDMVKIKSLGIKVVGETEFSSWYIKTPIISVTGTNGKTTTTELITHILKDKYSVKALGKETTTLDWLQEFWCPVTDPTTGRFGVPWDFMPEYFTKE
ncbi:MAG: hypothetical protein IJW28_02155, partial [Clostridia bacterium]|nr:hypothetical protein [Clostridia bacterium]